MTPSTGRWSARADACGRANNEGRGIDSPAPLGFVVRPSTDQVLAVAPTCSLIQAVDTDLGRVMGSMTARLVMS